MRVLLSKRFVNMPILGTMNDENGVVLAGSIILPEAVLFNTSLRTVVDNPGGMPYNNTEQVLLHKGGGDGRPVATLPSPGIEAHQVYTLFEPHS
jgi:hypothetical protein